MLFSSLTTSILRALSLVFALTTSTAFSAPSASATVTSPSRYYLKTYVVGGGHSDKEGLYVSGYHTGSCSSLFNASQVWRRQLLIFL